MLVSKIVRKPRRHRAVVVVIDITSATEKKCRARTASEKRNDKQEHKECKSSGEQVAKKKEKSFHAANIEKKLQLPIPEVFISTQILCKIILKSSGIWGEIGR